jgi:hypothetical protein
MDPAVTTQVVAATGLCKAILADLFLHHFWPSQRRKHIVFMLAQACPIITARSSVHLQTANDRRLKQSTHVQTCAPPPTKLSWSSASYKCCPRLQVASCTMSAVAAVLSPFPSSHPSRFGASETLGQNTPPAVLMARKQRCAVEGR